MHSRSERAGGASMARRCRGAVAMIVQPCEPQGGLDSSLVTTFNTTDCSCVCGEIYHSRILCRQYIGTAPNHRVSFCIHDLRIPFVQSSSMMWPSTAVVVLLLVSSAVGLCTHLGGAVDVKCDCHLRTNPGKFDFLSMRRIEKSSSKLLAVLQRVCTTARTRGVKREFLGKGGTEC